MSPRTAIVFDLDGTLIDSAPDIQAIANAILVPEGAAPLSLAETRDFIGNGATVFVARMRAARGIADTEQSRLQADFVARYEDAVALTRPYPGVVDALAALGRAGHTLGVCTNKIDRASRSVLAHLGLAGFFGIVVSGDTLSTQKPDPAPLLAAFDALGVGERIYVGDSEVDAETARRADLPFLLFTEGYRSAKAETLRHEGSFSDVADLPALVQDRLEVGYGVA